MKTNLILPILLFCAPGFVYAAEAKRNDSEFDLKDRAALQFIDSIAPLAGHIFSLRECLQAPHLHNMPDLAAKAYTNEAHLSVEHALYLQTTPNVSLNPRVEANIYYLWAAYNYLRVAHNFAIKQDVASVLDRVVCEESDPEFIWEELDSARILLGKLK